MSIVCICIISPKNAPVFTYAPATEEDDVASTMMMNDEGNDGESDAASSSSYCSNLMLKYQFIVHSALDHIAEKSSSSSSSGGNSFYLGSICPIESYRIYAYRTNSGVKVRYVLR
jgi:hypothetical protein